jgi:hypothetical protein
MTILDRVAEERRVGIGEDGCGPIEVEVIRAEDIPKIHCFPRVESQAERRNFEVDRFGRKSLDNHGKIVLMWIVE